MALMLKSFARLLPFAGLLGVLLGDAGPAYADSVSASATAWWGLNNNPCPAGQTSTGDTTASASAECAVDGNLSTTTASVAVGTLATEVLSASAFAFNGDRNVYAYASASFTTDLVVVGADVPGFVYAAFVSVPSTWSENPQGANGPLNANINYCNSWSASYDVFTNDFPGQSVCSTGVPYMPGDPFSFTAALFVGALSLQPGEYAQASATVAFQGFMAIDQYGQPIPGATVEEVPEPASLSPVAAGALLLAAVGVRRRRSITSPFLSMRANLTKTSWEIS